MICTQGFGNHAVRSADWRYIRYADGSEELYDQIKDARNFYNLAGDARYELVKRELATWLPAINAEPHPTYTGQQAMNEKYEALRDGR